MELILEYLKKIGQPFVWVLSTLGVIFLYKKFIDVSKPETVVNNDNRVSTDNSTSIEIDKIKKTSGANEVIANGKAEIEEIKKHIAPKLDPRKKTTKLNEKLVEANSNGKKKKVKRLTKRIEKNVIGKPSD
jgi:hypothetical protein